MSKLNNNQRFLAENVTKWRGNADGVGYRTKEQRAIFFDLEKLTGQKHDLNGFPIDESFDFELSKEQYESAQR